MTLQQLRYVVEISRCGSITAAAQRLFIAQPSLSKAVRELESELGITIFERSRSGVIFTADGLELLGQARLILEQTTTLKERFNTVEKKEKPCLLYIRKKRLSRKRRCTIVLKTRNIHRQRSMTWMKHHIM